MDNIPRCPFSGTSVSRPGGKYWAPRASSYNAVVYKLRGNRVRCKALGVWFYFATQRRKKTRSVLAVTAPAALVASPAADHIQVGSSDIQS